MSRSHLPRFRGTLIGLAVAALAGSCADGGRPPTGPSTLQPGIPAMLAQPRLGPRWPDRQRRGRLDVSSRRGLPRNESSRRHDWRGVRRGDHRADQPHVHGHWIQRAAAMGDGARRRRQFSRRGGLRANAGQPRDAEYRHPRHSPGRGECAQRVLLRPRARRRRRQHCWTAIERDIVTVGTAPTGAPGAPTRLTRQVTGNQVLLTWVAPAGNPPSLVPHSGRIEARI